MKAIIQIELEVNFIPLDNNPCEHTLEVLGHTAAIPRPYRGRWRSRRSRSQSERDNKSNQSKIYEGILFYLRNREEEA